MYMQTRAEASVDAWGTLINEHFSLKMLETANNVPVDKPMDEVA